MIIRIGRSSSNDVVLENRTVSREHAILEIVDGQIILKDQGSKSGTYVLENSKWQKKNYSVVREDDTISLGNEKLFVKDLIEHAAKTNREATFERNPITGEIVKR